MVTVAMKHSDIIHSDDDFISSDDDIILSGNQTIDSDEESTKHSIKDGVDSDLYIGSNTSVTEFALSIISLKYKHKLSESTVDDFLKLIKLILPSQNKCPKTSTKIISLLNIPELDNNSTVYKVCNNDNCAKEAVKSDETFECKCVNINIVYFFVFNIIPQIEKMLKNDSHLKQIKMSNEKKDSGSLKTALDSSIYKSLKTN